jgi:hypothetical protein
LDPRSCCQTAGLLRQEKASGCPGIHPISVLEATSIFPGKQNIIRRCE